MPATTLLSALPARHAPPPMLRAGAGAELLDYVDFKWLMAGEGHCIDLDRLRGDLAYASGCLALARGASSSTLRAAGARLARMLGRDPA